MVNTSEQMTRLYFPVWPMVIVAASGVAVGIAAMYWTKFRNSDRTLETATGVRNDDHACVLPCVLSLIEALQEHLERLQLEVSDEEWIDALCETLDAVEEELGRIRDASKLDISLDSIVKVIDEDLVVLLRKQQGVVFILDSYLPRPGQTWDDLLQIKNEDERRLYSDLSRGENKRVELVEILRFSINELASNLKQSCFFDASRGQQDAEILTRRYKLVRVFFATDREVTADAEYVGKMSRMISRQPVPLQYGWADVGIPDSHNVGTLEAPQKDSSEEADSSKHVVIFSVDTELRGNLQCFLKLVNDGLTIGQETSRELLVYIHGYNTSHLKAVKQAAQLKNDLGFKGTIILYSWSSTGTFGGYYTDQANIKEAARSLHLLLKEIMNEVKAPRAHILAHSMGNRALVGALHRLYEEADRRPRCPLSQIVLIAADEERSLFEELVQKINKTYPTTSQVEPANLSNINASCSSSRSGTDLNVTSSGIVDSRPHFSVYCSIKDKALALSRVIHGRKYRLGDTRSLFCSKAPDLGKQIDVIDTTDVNQGPSKYYHAYHLQSTEVIKDIQDLLKHGKPASARTSKLHEVEDEGKSFYAFNKERWPRSTRCIG